MPEVTEKTFYNAASKAVLRDGTLSLKLTVSAPYTPERKRLASAVVDKFSVETVEAVRDALELMETEALEKAVRMAKESAFEAASFARKKGEEV